MHSLARTRRRMEGLAAAAMDVDVGAPVPGEEDPYQRPSSE